MNEAPSNINVTVTKTPGPLSQGCSGCVGIVLLVIAIVGIIGLFAH